MSKKKTIEFNTKDLPISRSKKNKNSSYIIGVSGKDNNDAFKDSWQEVESSFLDLAKTTSSELKKINDEHEISKRGKDKIEKFYISMKETFETNRKLYLEFSKYKNNILKKELNSIKKTKKLKK